MRLLYSSRTSPIHRVIYCAKEVITLMVSFQVLRLFRSSFVLKSQWTLDITDWLSATRLSIYSVLSFIRKRLTTSLYNKLTKLYLLYELHEQSTCRVVPRTLGKATWAFMFNSTPSEMPSRKHYLDFARPTSENLFFGAKPYDNALVSLSYIGSVLYFIWYS